MLSIFWKRLTTAGAQASMIVGTVSTLLLIYLSPTIQVDILKAESAWFPLRNPGIVTIPLSFVVAVLVSLLRPVPAERADSSSSSGGCTWVSNSGSGGFGAVVSLGRLIGLALAALGLIVIGAYLALRSNLPQPGSTEYEQVTRAFYRGLAALEVGLLDDARDQFARATELVPEEPASWANLALARLRLGDADGAAPAIERALSLAPNRADILLLASRLESARGQRGRERRAAASRDGRRCHRSARALRPGRGAGSGRTGRHGRRGAAPA